MVESLEIEKKNAATSAIQERRSEIEKLETERVELEGIKNALQVELAQLQERISTTELQQIETISAFNACLTKRFQEVAEDAPAFLGTVALIRAVLGSTNQGERRILSSSRTHSLLFSKAVRDVSTLEPTDITDRTCGAFNQAGFDATVPTALLSAWASGFVPLLCGFQAKEMLDVATDSLAGGRQFSISIPPVLSAPSDLLCVSGCSREGVGSLGDFLTEATHNRCARLCRGRG